MSNRTLVELNHDFCPRDEKRVTNLRPLREIEKEAILEAIMATGSIAQAAIRLEISRPRIHRLLRRHNLSLKASEITAELRKQRKLLKHFVTLT